jgi:hypothetical protein
MGEFDCLSALKNRVGIAYCYNKTVNNRRQLVALVLPLGYLTRCPSKKAQP